MTLTRRVYKSEFQSKLGYGSTWFRKLQIEGVIPPGYRDPGGKRMWWPEEVVADTLHRMQANAVPADTSARTTA